MAQKLRVENPRIDSPSFEAHGRIPERHTGDGEDISPALEWSGVPEGLIEQARLIGTYEH